MSDQSHDARVAQRYALRRPGYHLVCYRRLVRPLFRVTLRVLTLEKKALPPIMEFVLKSLNAGLTSGNDVAGLLGLERKVLDDALWELMESGDVIVHAPIGTKAQRLMLSERGQQTLNRLSLQTTKEVELPVIVDGLTHQIAAEYRDEDLLRVQELAKLGLPEVAPYPRQYRPSVDELRPDLPTLFSQLQRGLRSGRREILDIVDINWEERRFRQDALALVYRSIYGDAVEVDLVVDGRFSELHDAAFRRGDQATELGRINSKIERAEVLFTEMFGAEIVSRLPSIEETGRLREEADATRETAHRLRDDLQQSSSGSKHALSSQLQTAHDKYDELRMTLDSQAIRWLEVFEQPRYLGQVLMSAQERLIVLSPRICRDVVDAEVMQHLREALSRKVSISIGYGYEGSEVYESDLEVIRELEVLARTRKGLRLQQVRDVPANVLAYDRQFAAVTRFPWLAHQADARQPFRDERGLLVRDADLVEHCFSRSLAVFK